MKTHLAELGRGDARARGRADDIVKITRGLFKLNDDDLDEVRRLVERRSKPSSRKRR